MKSGFFSGPKRPKRQIRRKPGRHTHHRLFELVALLPESGRAGWAVDIVVPIKSRRLVSRCVACLMIWIRR